MEQQDKEGVELPSSEIIRPWKDEALSSLTSLKFSLTHKDKSLMTSQNSPEISLLHYSEMPELSMYSSRKPREVERIPD